MQSNPSGRYKQYGTRRYVSSHRNFGMGDIFVGEILVLGGFMKNRKHAFTMQLKPHASRDDAVLLKILNRANCVNLHHGAAPPAA